MPRDGRTNCSGSRRPPGMRTMRVYAEAALGLLELGLGRVQRAVEHLDETARLCAEYGNSDPSTVPYGPDRDRGAAARRTSRSARRRRWRNSRRWPRACAARGRRPPPRAAAGCVEDDFDAWFERATPRTARRPRRSSSGGRSSCHGERLRRARRVREARERLRSALERFEALGAAPWAARARAELRAAGGAVRPGARAGDARADAAGAGGRAGRRDGATNREVAATLFVSPKTVEVHLTRIFKKLGVRSRTELARVVAMSALVGRAREREPAGPARRRARRGAGRWWASPGSARRRCSSTRAAGRGGC